MWSNEILLKKIYLIYYATYLDDPEAPPAAAAADAVVSSLPSSTASTLRLDRRGGILYPGIAVLMGISGLARYF